MVVADPPPKVASDPIRGKGDTDADADADSNATLSWALQPELSKPSVPT